MEERDKKLKEKLWSKQVQVDLRSQVLQYAQQVSRELRISFFFHYFISCKEKELRNLARQLANFQKFYIYRR